MTNFDPTPFRERFPILKRSVNGHPLVYLDNGASSQVPKSVSDSITAYEQSYRANVHRGVHTLSQQATNAYEAVRQQITQFIGATVEDTIIHTSGTTASINLVAQTWGRSNITAGDQIIVSQMEHHSNIVPWQILAESCGAQIVVWPVTPEGALELETLQGLLNDRVKLVAVTHTSNVLGTVNPIQQITKMVHAAGALVLVDGAQAVPHEAVDVCALDADFFAFSGHKMFGPNGVGVLYGKPELLAEMPPWMGGGDMIKHVSFDGSTWADPPARFEAGTPNVGGVIGLGAAIDFLNEVNRPAAHAHEIALLNHATEELLKIDTLRIIGTAPNKASVISFVIDGAHSQDIGTLLDMSGIATRTGHHCAEPLLSALNITATTRASFLFTNTHQEVEFFVAALNKTVKMLT
jgi:cysteine desulfurase/selenocysteine lyase